MPYFLLIFIIRINYLVPIPRILILILRIYIVIFYIFSSYLCDNNYFINHNLPHKTQVYMYISYGPRARTGLFMFLSSKG